MTRCQAGYLTIYHSGYKRVWFQAEYLYDVDLSRKEKELEEYLVNVSPIDFLFPFH